MAFEKGNKLGAKGRLFDGALRRAIAQDDGVRLRRAAESLLDAAAAGEAWAINQLADRLDGKAQQNVSVEHKDVSSLSLAELAAELATAIATGDGQAAEGPDESRAVH